MRKLMLRIKRWIVSWRDYLLLSFAWWVARRYDGTIVRYPHLSYATAKTIELQEYVRVSGHLNTVSGRRPNAVRRLNKDLESIADTLTRFFLVPGGTDWGLPSDD